MPNEITDDEVKRYIETSGSNCLFCAGENLHAGSMRGGSIAAFQDVACKDCGQTWREIYHLAEIQYPARPDFAPVERP